MMFWMTTLRGVTTGLIPNPAFSKLKRATLLGRGFDEALQSSGDMSVSAILPSICEP
jgi:hypothetical protein